MKKGIIGVVVAKRHSPICITNDVGGTSLLRVGLYHVRITKSFVDHETGTIMHGELIDPEQIKKARSMGTTNIDLEKYKERFPTNLSIYRDAVKARKNFRPEAVFFNASQFMPDVVPPESLTPAQQLRKAFWPGQKTTARSKSRSRAK